MDRQNQLPINVSIYLGQYLFRLHCLGGAVKVLLLETDAYGKFPKYLA